MILTHTVELDGRAYEVPLSLFTQMGDPFDWFATTAFVREPHFMTCDGRTRIVRKRNIKLAARDRLINAGDIALVSWEAIDPVKLWINRMPVVATQTSPYLFRPRTAGEHRIVVRDARYRSDPLVIVVRE